VERDLHLARQRRRPPDRRAVRAALLPRQHLGADGGARARALSQGRAGEEVHRHRLRRRRRSSNAAFEDQIKKVGKDLVDKIYAPVANKDYSPYITKILQSGAQGCYVALQGDEARAFYSQATQYGLAQRVQFFTEIVAQADIKVLGKDAIGLMGSSRYPLTYDIPQNKAFREAFMSEYKNEIPDWTDGEMYQALMILFAAIEKAGSPEPMKVVAAMEDLDVTSVKGPILMRKCDHQGENQGFVVKVAKNDKFAEPIGEIVKIYPRELNTPDCRSASFSK
jgi:branched-chain amino acid transport system substrate-binding protein